MKNILEVSIEWLSYPCILVLFPYTLAINLNYFIMLNRYGIRIAGPAGLGMHSVMDIIANTFSTLGYNVITDSEYQSIIKGGLNFYDVNICSASPYIAREVDVLISLNEKNITPNLGDLRK